MSNLKENQKTKFNQQEILQAIVFADDFVRDLKLVQHVYPSVLFPVVTTPLFDYLIDSLIRSRVKQVFLYCSNHIEIIKKYIEQLKEYHDRIGENSIKITPIISDGCRSLGDALRDIDTNGWIRGDFILIRSSAFANLDFNYYMDLHKLRKEKDKNASMTMILRDLGSIKNSLLKNESSLTVSNASTRKLLYYKKLDSDHKKVDLELQWFLENDKIRIDNALMDTHIYLCSASVLPLFADNFDYQTIEDFIYGVLMNEEFLDSRIYWEPLNSQAYALPFFSWNSYRTLSRDILQRYCYPLVPDTLPLSLKDFIYMPKSTYRHCNSILSRGCNLDTESIIGENSVLKENSNLTKSIISSDCTIGMNVKIENSYILSNVTIGDDSFIKDSIIFSNCKILKGSTLTKCVMLPNTCCLEENLSYESMLFEIDDDGKITYKKAVQNESDGNISLSNSFIDNNEADYAYDADTSSSTSRSRSNSWSSTSMRESPVPPRDDNEIFSSEVIDSLLRGYQDELNCENLILEINSSRYAYNVSMQQVSYNVVKAILILPSHYTSETDDSKNIPSAYQKTLKSMVKYFQPILENYIKTDQAQEDCLRAIQDVASTNHETLLPCVQYLLHTLYDNDILSEEKILEWYEQNEIEDLNEDDEERQPISEALKKVVTPFITWLKTAEEDSSSS